MQQLVLIDIPHFFEGFEVMSKRYFVQVPFCFFHCKTLFYNQPEKCKDREIERIQLNKEMDEEAKIPIEK